MAGEHELTTLRDAITAAEYAQTIAEQRLEDARRAVTDAKDAYLSAALNPAVRPSAGFAAMPAPGGRQCGHACPHCAVLPC